MSDVVASSEALVAAPAGGARLRAVLTGAGPFLLVVGAGAARGGYFPGSWGWLTLASAWAAALVLILDDEARLTRAGAVAVAALGGFTGWTLLSVVWSSDATATVQEAQRVLVYVTALVGALLVCRRSPAAFLVGTWAAVWTLSTYGLLTKLVPERLGVYDSISSGRLSEPIGYWNALGAFAAMGTLLAVGLVARGERAWLRRAAAASVPMLLVTQYLTFSRGAAIALGCGVVALVVLEPRRLHLLVRLAAIAPWGVAAVALASRRHAVTTLGVTLGQASHDGHRLAVELLVLVLAGTASAWALDRGAPRVAISPAAHRRAGAALIAVLVLALGGTFVHFGAPWTLAQRAWHDFSTNAPSGTELTQHYYTLHTTRLVAWRAALHMAEAHPALGGGAGTYESYWLLHRGDATKLRDAHSLYLQTLGEVGPVGLLLLVAALGAALWAGMRGRRRRFGAPVVAAFVVYLVHVSGDWDWQVAAVTLVALLCAAFLLTDEGTRPEPAKRRSRRMFLAVCAVAALAGLYGIAEQVALGRIDSARSVAEAQSAARTAADLAPWSTEPWQRLGEFATQDARFAVARTALDRALAKDPGNWQLWLDLAEASKGLPLIDALRRAERLNPHSPEIVAFRAQLLFDYRLSRGH